MTTQPSADQTKVRIIQLISAHLGQSTAVAYESMFVSMPLELVIKSSQDLLTEYVGPTKARNLIVAVCQQ